MKLSMREKHRWALRALARKPIPLNVIYECGWEMQGVWRRVDVLRELYVWQEVLH